MGLEVEGLFGGFRVELIQRSHFDAPRRADLARFTEMFERTHALPPQASFDALERRNAVEGRRFGAMDAAKQPDSPLFVECIGVDQARSHVAAWNDLAARALESNIFLDPAFALTAARHISGTNRPKFILVWNRDETTPRKRLIALWPIRPPRRWFGSALETWVHDYCCSGAPLIDRTAALASLDAVAAFLDGSNGSTFILSMAQLRLNGPIVSLLRRFAAARGLPLEIVAEYDRAALDVTRKGHSAPDFASRRKRKELRRQARRLQEKGPLSVGVTREGPELIRQIEAFLILEAKGWKGRSGGAFLNRPEHACFVRAMAERMGAQMKCRIYWMAVGEKVIASNIVLVGDGSSYFWKTAYDEDFAFASPGVLLTMNMTDALLCEPRLLSVDSCAISAHPMIDHLWRDRISMVDVMLCLRADRSRAFDGAARRERWRLFLRERAKSAWRRFRPA